MNWWFGFDVHIPSAIILIAPHEQIDALVFVLCANNKCFLKGDGDTINQENWIQKHILNVIKGKKKPVLNGEAIRKPIQNVLNNQKKKRKERKQRTNARKNKMTQLVVIFYDSQRHYVAFELRAKRMYRKDILWHIIHNV